MLITQKELQMQTEDLVKTVGLNTPEQIGCIVVMVNRQDGTICARAVKISKEHTVEALKNIIKGYGDQAVTEGVDFARH